MPRPLGGVIYLHVEIYVLKFIQRIRFNGGYIS